MNRDILLIDLVVTTNAGGPRIPVALLIDGALLTGEIADTRDYADAHPGVPVAPASNDPQFVHLANATVNGQPRGWWRVLIERVDGFSLQGVPVEAPAPSP